MDEIIKWIRRIIMIILAIPAGMFAVFLLILALSKVIPNSPGEVFRFESPDNSHAVVITVRTETGSWDVDPAIHVIAFLTDQNGKREEFFRDKFEETSDLSKPTVEWRPNEVIVSGLNSRREISARTELHTQNK
jgi:hypothetical protein